MIHWSLNLHHQNNITSCLEKLASKIANIGAFPLVFCSGRLNESCRGFKELSIHIRLIKNNQVMNPVELFF
jgi:hypothetical protein